MNIHALKRHALMSLIALAAFAGALGVQLSQTPEADAAVIGFCGNAYLYVNSANFCQGGQVEGAYEVYGWGEHSVCVELQPWSARHCSTGTNGVYSGEVPAADYYGVPTIGNNANVNQYVSAVYLTR